MAGPPQVDRRGRWHSAWQHQLIVLETGEPAQAGEQAHEGTEQESEDGEADDGKAPAGDSGDDAVVNFEGIHGRRVKAPEKPLRKRQIHRGTEKKRSRKQPGCT